LIELDRRQRVTLIWAGLAVVLAGFEGSILILALPAIAREFHANIPALSALGSILAIGTLGALPLANLADRYGRRRLIAVGVAGFSLVNFASGFVGSLAGLAFLRLFAVCFEVLVLGVSTALIVEEAPPRSRGQAVSVLALLSGFGTGITVIAYPILAPNWRLLFLVSGVGVLAAPLIWWLLPEGRTWQGVRVTGSALRLLMQPPWRRRILILSAMFALFAVLLEPAADGQGILDFHHDIDGSGGQFLYMPGGGSLNPPTHETVDKKMHYVHQEGSAVFKYAVRRMAELAAEMVQRNGLQSQDIALVVPHQANLRIIRAMQERLALSDEKVMVNIDRYGNTTAGTIPLGLRDAVDQQRLKKGDLVLLMAVGAGYTTGSVLLRWAY